MRSTYISGKRKILIVLAFLAIIAYFWYPSFLRLLPFKLFTSLPPEHITSPLPGEYARLLESKGDHYLIKNVAIIPMTQDTILHKQNLLIENGKILQIEQSLDQIKVRPSTIEIDGSGKYLIPGLSDMHSHINDDNNLLLMVAKGVTTTRNMAGFPFHLKMKKEIDEGKILGPKLYTTGPIMEGPHQIWRNTPGGLKITAVDSIENQIQQIQNQGFDFLKVYHTLSPQFYRKILQVADQKNIPALGHMPLEVPIEEMLKMSQYSIEHIEVEQLREISPELSLEEKAQQIGQSGKWVCPTLIVFKKMNGKIGDENLLRDYEQFVDKETRAFWAARLNNRDNEYALRKQLLKIIWENGGKILSGTDCINAYVLPGFSLHEELEELADSGLSEFEVLKTTTINPAFFLNTIEYTGTIETGKTANLLLLNQNPLKDIRAVRDIDGVMLKGKWLKRKELEEILLKIRKAYLN